MYYSFSQNLRECLLKNHSVVLIRELYVTYRSEGATYTCCNYGSYDDQIWLDELSCDGDENHFDECYHYGWGFHDCGATEHVVITCLGPSVGN